MNETSFNIIDLQFLGRDQTIASYLVSDNDEYALIDCGPYSTYATLRDQLKNIGVPISKIKYLFLTHIHFDHAGAAWALANEGVTVCVHPVGLPHLQSPDKLYQSAKQIYGHRMEELWGEMKSIDPSLLLSISHGTKIALGNSAFVGWHTPGHATHHIAWQWQHHLFCGDAAGIRVKNHIIAPPCPPPDIHIGHWLQSIDLMRSLPVHTLHLAHFGSFTDPYSHFDVFEQSLIEWATFIRDFAETNTPIEEVVPKFVQFVNEWLKEHGLSDDEIARYENANPAFMSVAGLMRYWKKFGLNPM